MSPALRTLLALAALLAAALAALLFPAMHRLLLLIPFALLALFASGCSSGVAARLAKMPDGRFSSARLEEAGKFTATTITLDGVTKDDGELHAQKIRVEHNNPWVQRFVFEATDYQAQLSAAAKKKPLPPLATVPPAKEPAPAVPAPAAAK